MSPKQIKQKLYSRRRIDQDGCWLWTGSTLKGYGRTEIKGEPEYLVHRLSFKVHKGPIPEGLWILHHCDKPLCFKPKCLWAGTAQQNSDDMVAKGRSLLGDLNPARIHKDRMPRGDQNGARKYPERILRGANHPLRKHPEKAARGDRHGWVLHPERIPRGVANGRAKLTESAVRKLRAMHETKKFKNDQLAVMFGISVISVSRVCNYRTYTNIK